MQGTFCCRAAVLGMVMLTALSIGMTAHADSGKKGHVICSTLPDPTGLVMDNRGNAYTADGRTGEILCVPPDGKPILYGRIDGSPTALAVDRLRTVFVGTQSGVVRAILLDGTVERVCTCSGRIAGLSVDRDGNLLVATENGTLLRIARSDMAWNR